MSEEGNKKEVGVLVWILLKTEPETRNRAQVVFGGVNCRKLSEDVGKETQGGAKSQYGVYQSGGYNCRQLGLSLIADPLKSQRTCLRSDSPRVKKSVLQLPSLIDEGWPPGIASLSPFGLPCGQTEQGPYHWGEPSSTEAEG